MSLIRVLRTAQVTLSHTFNVDETPTDASGGVTVTVKRLDGSVVISGAAAAHPGPPGFYTYAPPAQADVDMLTVDWSGSIGGATVTVRDFLEIVGGFLFDLAAARSMPKPLSVTTYPTAVLARKRVEVEQECERICQRAFVPRFARVALSGRGLPDLALPHADVRVLRAVRVGGVDLTPTELASVAPSPSGVISRGVPSSTSLRWGAVWPVGVANVIVEYEHGLDYSPDEISTAGIIRLRSKVTDGDTSVPYRAISFTVQDGGVYRLSTPSKERTGIPAVDAAYAGWVQDLGGFA